MSSTGSPEQHALEYIACPYCSSVDNETWAQERSFIAVRCRRCRLIFCNPRLRMADIDEAVRSGAHGVAADGLEVVSYRTATKVRIYRRILRKLFADLWQRGLPISWLDVGAGYGEVVEAVSALAPAGSRIEGIEPMQPKARAARARGLAVNNEYLRPDHAKVDVVSVIDVFSHIPDFAQFLSVISRVLTPRGEVFIETGNLADLDRRDEFPGETSRARDPGFQLKH